MKPEYEIRKMSWIEFEKRRQETKLILIPTGGVEVYGPHLPLGTDGLMADYLAKELAQRTGGLIAPSIQLNDSSVLQAFPGTISISPELFCQWIDELMESLISYGFRHYFFISGHAANAPLINSVARKKQIAQGIAYAQVDWWRFAAEHDQGIFKEKGKMAHGHASECGTSAMLYAYPELVQMDLATRRVPPEKTLQYEDFHRYVPMTERTDNGTIGDATAASRQKGEILVQRCLDRMEEFIVQEWGGGKNHEER